MYTSVPPIPTNPAAHGDPQELRKWLADVGHLIDAHGVDRCRPELADLTRTARAHGIDNGAVDALADAGSPAPVTARAFAKVGSALLALRTSIVGPRDTDVAA